MQLVEIARRSVELMDLTSLGDDDTPLMIKILCERALEHGVAAVCVWPRFVHQCADATEGSSIRVATVVNFPHGENSIDAAVMETERCIRDGAHEIDLVMPYRDWLAGNERVAREMICSVKHACGDNCLKVILETGALGSPERIAAASRLAIESGANFIKTSSGKIPLSATPTAAESMLKVIRDSANPVGFKAAGGIRTLRQAGNYLRLADRIMGEEWVNAAHFRLGASSLLDACLPYIYGDS
jgi:deoxyribose-phosphate aldolase